MVMASLECLINLITCMFYDLERKPKYQEKTYTHRGEHRNLIEKDW